MIVGELLSGIPRAQLSAYLADLQSRLHLPASFQIKLQDQHPEPGKAATVTCVYGRRMAHLQLAADFHTYPPEEQRQVLVHELIHIVMDPIDTAVNNTQKALGSATFEIAYAAFRDADEYVTDQLADVIAPFMPLPPWTQTSTDTAATLTVSGVPPVPVLPPNGTIAMSPVGGY